MTNLCLDICNNYISISNNKYIINNSFTYNRNNITNYGLYIGEGVSYEEYELLNIPRHQPLTFYIDNCSNYDISNIIDVNYNTSYNNPIIIYVSKGNDISFNNGDYFRFYDTSYNLININIDSHSQDTPFLTNSGDNFYFMNDVSYQFIPIIDFSSSYRFGISGTPLNNTNNYILSSIDSSFIINIPSNADNNNYKIFYYDVNNSTISGELRIARDDYSYNYYYDNIIFRIFPDFSNQNISLSIKSINSDISNINFFNYNSNCLYIHNNTSIIGNRLNSINKECLSRVSRARANISSYLSSIYELNVNTHFDSQDSNNNRDLSYSIYDGTYYIFDICANYPIKVHNDSSNVLRIDSSYIYTSIYPYSDNSYYYYDAIKLEVNFSEFDIDSNIDQYNFKLKILDRNNSDALIDFNLDYESQCINYNPSQYTGNTTFYLYNQYDNSFNGTNDDYYNNQNRYKLNIYDEYVEPSNNENIYFVASDKYGHNLSNRVINNSPQDLSSILLYTNNYSDNNFLITYILRTYEEETIFRYRYVEINYGPFIEISGLSNNYYQNSNNFNDIINISFNNDSPFDISNIFVYLKKNQNEKIYLKYDIEFIYLSRITRLSSHNDFSYERPDIENIRYNKNVKFPNNILGRNFYLSYNLKHFNYLVNSSENLLPTLVDGSQPIVLQNICGSQLYLDNTSSKILNDKYILSFSSNPDFRVNENNNYANFSNNFLNNNFLIFSSLTTTSYEVIDIQENNEDNSYGSIQITQFDISLDQINTKISLNNHNFIIEFSYVELELSNNDLTIRGNFLKNKIFDNDHIDMSYIGNYNIKINPVGLSNNDYFYNTISNDISFLSNAQDISKNYIINVVNNIDISIGFINPTRQISTTYIYNFPYSETFNIIPIENNFDSSNILFLSDICYGDFLTSVQRNANKPIIQYINNSIYNITLSYELFDLSNITLDPLQNTLSLSDNTVDPDINGSYGTGTIQYIIIDICNKTLTIDLSINFKNIPDVSLAGDLVIHLEIGQPYNDAGIIISDINNYTRYINQTTLTTSNFNDFSFQFIPIIIDEQSSYELSFNATDLCLNRVNLDGYVISYTVTDITDYRMPNTIKTRLIIVHDTRKPYILFPNLSSINYDFSTIGITNYNSLLSSRDISYSFDNSYAANIDFSLSVFSSLNDLSTIINK